MCATSGLLKGLDVRSCASLRPITRSVSPVGAQFPNTYQRARGRVLTLLPVRGLEGDRDGVKMAEGQPGLERRGKPRQSPLVASRVSTATGRVAQTRAELLVGRGISVTPGAGSKWRNPRGSWGGLNWPMGELPTGCRKRRRKRGGVAAGAALHPPRRLHGTALASDFNDFIRRRFWAQPCRSW